MARQQGTHLYYDPLSLSTWLPSAEEVWFFCNTSICIAVSECILLLEGPLVTYMVIISGDTWYRHNDYIIIVIATYFMLP